MTKLNLSPDSKQLEKILRNKYLFEWYSQMIFDDFESEMRGFELVAMFTNPEAFKKYKEISGKYEIKNNSEFKDGIEATKELEKFKTITIEEGIEDIE
jgi:hypothetical protein